MTRTLKDNDALYIGSKDGIRKENRYVWRMIRDGENLLIQRYDVGTGWVTKSTING